jgi:predicted nucleic acid-binding protein
MKVYYAYLILRHISTTQVAILRKVHCDEKTRRTITLIFLTNVRIIPTCIMIHIFFLKFNIIYLCII